MASELRELANLIAKKVDEIESILESKDLVFPSLDDTFSPETEAARNDPQILSAVVTLIGAADQLICVARPPARLLTECSMAHYNSAALGVVLATHTPEILREAGPKGLHVDDIAKANGLHPQKLARILRTLATKHIFKERSPNVFVHNRPSSLLDSGKSYREIQANPNYKYENTLGVGALLEWLCDDMFKGSSSLVENITNPETALSEEPDETPLNTYFGTKATIFEWLEYPGNDYRRERFGKAMVASRNVIPPEMILKGFDWGSLSGRTIVDVGGGFGSTSAVLTKAFPALKIVVQDRDVIIGDARKYWESTNPEAIASGTVKLEAHDFFTNQPPRGVGAFLLRLILHDWSDKYASIILRALHTAASSSTKLVIVDNIVPFACKPDVVEDEIPGAHVSEAPVPLLANFGLESMRMHLMDMNMLVGFNGVERTLSNFVNLLESSGWRLESVFRHPGAIHAQLIARPA